MDEIAALQKFILQLSERVWRQSELLSRLTERKDKPMSVLIGVDGKLPGVAHAEQVMRLGGASSQSALFAILFAGYAVGKYPESRRVRNWIESAAGKFYGPEYAARLAAEAPGLPQEFDITRSRKALRALIAYNHDDCHWLTLAHSTTRRNGVSVRRDTASRAIWLRPPTCPILRGLCAMYTAWWGDDYSETAEMAVSAKDVPACLTALESVVENLKASCWYEKIQRVITVFRTAVASKASVSCG